MRSNWSRSGTPLPGTIRSVAEKTRGEAERGFRSDAVLVEPREQFRTPVAQAGGLPIADAIGGNEVLAREFPELRPPDLEEFPGFPARQDFVIAFCVAAHCLHGLPAIRS